MRIISNMPLFTPFNKTTIQQGNIGNCSLLTVLDCLMNTSTEGLDFVKSMFDKTEEGIIVRIKRTYHSNNLKDKNLTQYRYFYDSATDQDVFFVSQEKCEEMEVETKGVKTDALAVKILERICSYYFYNNWQTVTNSIEAHDIRVIRYADSQQFGTFSFIAEWLSLDTQPIAVEDYWMLKQLLSNLPVYLSFELYPGFRHAFRLEDIERINEYSADREVVVRNPWHNRKREKYLLSHVLSSNPSFYLIKSDSIHYELAGVLIKNKPILKVWFAELYKLLKLSTSGPNMFDVFHPKLQALIQVFGDTLLHFVQEERLSEQHLETMQCLQHRYKEGLDHWVSQRLSPKTFQSASSAFSVWKRPSIPPKILYKSAEIIEETVSSCK